MRNSVWSKLSAWLVRPHTAIAAALTLLMFAASASPSLAISPATGPACTPNPKSISFLSSPPSSATITVPANTTVTVTLTNATAGRILRDGGAFLDAAVGPTTGTIVNNTGVTQTVVLSVPAGFSITGDGVTAIVLRFDCVTNVIGPVVIDPGVAASVGQLIQGGLATIKDREPMRVRGLYDTMMETAGWWWEYFDCCEEYDSRADYEDDLTDAVAEIEDIEASIRNLEAAVPANEADASYIAVRLFELRKRWVQVNDDIDCITSSDYWVPGDADRASEEAFLQDYPRYVEDYNEFVGPYFEGPDGRVHLGAVGAWQFSALLDSAIIDSSFDAIARQARIGSLSVLGSTHLSDTTILGGGLKIGIAEATTSTSELTQRTVGADILLMHMLMPGLIARLYGGWEYDWNWLQIGATTASFPSRTVKVGAGLQGRFPIGNNLILAPDVSGLFQYTSYSSFTNSANVTIPEGSLSQFNIAAGGRLSRDFLSPAHGLMFSPYVGAYLLYNSVVGTAWPGQSFVSGARVQALAGVELNWGGNVQAHLQGDVTYGDGYWAAGFDAKLHVPIEE